MHEVVYLTGAPASGKSSLTRALSDVVQPLEVFEYGQRLTAFLANKARDAGAFTQEDLRNRSAAIATPDDIQALDRVLLDFVAEERSRAPIIVDSHAVTKEQFGFRITPFTLEDFARLAPTQIWMLYTPPEVTVERIKADAKGRPLISAWEASFHTQMQASVAITYAMRLGLAVHVIDSSRSHKELVAELAPRLQRPGSTASHAGAAP